MTSCEYCGALSGVTHTPGCQALDPYGVPSGYVPRMTATEVKARQVKARWLLPKPVDPVAKAVDDYILMERKAQAWDELRALVGQSSDEIASVVARLMDSVQGAASGR